MFPSGGGCMQFDGGSFPTPSYTGIADIGLAASNAGSAPFAFHKSIDSRYRSHDPWTSF